MEFIIAEWINHPKLPKWVRYLLVTVVSGLVVFLGVMLALQSPMYAGRIFGGVLSVLFFVVWIYLIVKVAKSTRPAEDDRN